jgi:hypothetical protein
MLGQRFKNSPGLAISATLLQETIMAILAKNVRVLISRERRDIKIVNSWCIKN